MTTANLSTTPLSKRLEVPVDWREWYEGVRKRAINADVPEFVNLTQAVDPEFAFVAPRKPQPRDFKANAAEDAVIGLENLTSAEATRFQAAHAIYREELRDYERTKAKLEAIKNLIPGSINQRYMHHITDVDTLYGMLKALKQHVSLDIKLEKELREADWAKLMHPNKTVNIEVWTQDVLYHYNLGKTLKCKYTTEEYDAIQDFVSATEKVFPHWHAQWSSHVITHHLEGNLRPFKRYVELFQQEYRVRRLRAGGRGSVFEVNDYPPPSDVPEFQGKRLKLPY